MRPITYEWHPTLAEKNNPTCVKWEFKIFHNNEHCWGHIEEVLGNNASCDDHNDLIVRLNPWGTKQHLET